MNITIDEYGYIKDNGKQIGAIRTEVVEVYGPIFTNAPEMAKLVKQLSTPDANEHAENCRQYLFLAMPEVKAMVERLSKAVTK